MCRKKRQREEGRQSEGQFWDNQVESLVTTHLGGPSPKSLLHTQEKVEEVSPGKRTKRALTNQEAFDACSGLLRSTSAEPRPRHQVVRSRILEASLSVLRERNLWYYSAEESGTGLSHCQMSCRSQLRAEFSNNRIFGTNKSSSSKNSDRQLSCNWRVCNSVRFLERASLFCNTSSRLSRFTPTIHPGPSRERESKRLHLSSAHHTTVQEQRSLL